MGFTKFYWSLQNFSIEQTVFLKKLILGELTCILHALDQKNFYLWKTFENGWKLTEETGTGNLFNEQGEIFSNQNGLVYWT